MDDAIENARRKLAAWQDRRKLEMELRKARHCLAAEYRPHFETARFDFANKRLIGNGYALQWQLRPIAAARGTVTLVELETGSL